MKVALVYDRVNKWGGAERVLLALHTMFPNAPLYTSVYDAQKALWAKVFSIKTSFLQKMPFTTSNHEYVPFLMPLAFEQFSFDEYDLVISVTSEAAKGIITKPHTKHICYCLTPTRYLWSGYEDYFSNKLLKTAGHPLVSSLRKWDLVAANRPDVFVSLSKEVQGRIKKYYGREAAVIYPAITINDYQSKGSKMKNKDYFLVVSRFVPYKRIDLAIKASNALKLPLKIIGYGRDEMKLRSFAGPTIEFLGTLSDEKVAEYYRNAKALIFPGIEDFGLTIVESQHFGTPVIAFRGGAATETILEGKTGYFFNEQSKDSLVEALKKFNSYKFNPEETRQQAAKFGFARFKKEMLLLIDKIM